VISLLALCVAVAIAVYGFRVAATSHWIGPGSSGNPQSAKISNTIVPRLAANDPKPLRCPPAGLQTLQPSSVTGHHKVILTWNASIPSANAESAAAGYCLYRSKKRKAAKQNPTCNDCEQINVIPIAGTGCIDDLVEDGAGYYYVVTAISANQKISSSSNETPAQIPLNKPAASSAPAGSRPLCRATAAPQ
jgi:hypothetical protein